MRVTKMLMLEVGTYDDPFQRPYQSHVDGRSLTQLQDATRGGLNLEPAALGAVGSQIMRISPTAHSRVQIDQGFDTHRLCFMMEIEFPGSGGMVAIEYLMGYTSHVGVSALYGESNLTFDRTMRLYFNNVMQATRTVAANAFGRQHHIKANRAYQLINGEYMPQITTLNQSPHLLRPQDVFTSMSMQQARTMMRDEEIYDVRPTFGPEKLAVSHRMNAIPGNYLSRFLKTWQANSEHADLDIASSNSQMAASVAEPTISRIRSLQDLTTVSNIRQGGSVTWGELCAAEDTGSLEDRVDVHLALSPQNKALLSSRGSMSHWGGNDLTTVMATSFIQAVPGMMMQLMLTRLDFSITNKTLDGSWITQFNGVESFNDGDNIRQIEAFRFSLENELMPGLTNDGMIPVEIHAMFSVESQTQIEIQAGDALYMTPFMAPSFCDGLFAPVRAPDEQTLGRFAHGLSQITTTLETDYSAGGFGYEPHDTQFSSIIDTQGNKYENSGSL